jgi:hypothetical protein
MDRRRTAVVVMGMLLALAPGSARRAEAQSFPGNEVLSARANGSGNIVVAPGRLGSFSFRIDPRTVGQTIPGQVTFVDPVTRVRVVSQRIASGFTLPGFVFVEGVCTINGVPSVFQIEAFNGATPGERDSFFICFGGEFSSTCEGGFVLGGTVRVEGSRFR